MLRCIVAVFGVLVLSGCAPDTMNGDPIADGGDLGPVDVPDGGMPLALRFNQIQMRGTVNSYHDYYREGIIPEAIYRHLAIDRQGAEQGIRQFDFDLSADRRSGQFLEPKNAESGVDAESHCAVWDDCLRELRDWSDAHRDHPMVVVLVGESEIHLDLMPHLHLQLGLLEEVIIHFLGRPRIYTPDDMRRGFPTLRAAIDRLGWPTVAETRGKVLFVLKDRGPPRAAYIMNGGFDPDDKLLFVAGDPAQANNPALADEVIFSFEPDWPWAYETDPADLPIIEELVASGLLVHAMTDDPAFAAQLRDAGVHMLGTRFPEILPPVLEQPIVCNPVTRPEGCPADVLEPR